MKRNVPVWLRPAPMTVVVAVLMAVVAGCGEEDADEGRAAMPEGYQVATSYARQLGVDLDAMERRSTGLYVQDVVVGDGPRADSGDIAVVHYTGWMSTGREFDSSDDRPFEVALGYGRVIDGWDQGVVGMRVGGERRLVIPPALGYGERRMGPIIPNSTLVFDIRLLDVTDRTPAASADSADTGDDATR